MLTPWLPAGGGGMSTARAAETEMNVNLAMGKPAYSSSKTSDREADKAVDGNPTTYWQPLAADRQDMNVWLYVDLGRQETFNKTVIQFKAGRFAEYKIQYSDDGVEWKDAFVKNGSIGSLENIMFEEVTGRYVKLDLSLASDNNVQVAEFEVYNFDGQINPEPDNLQSVYFVNEQGQRYKLNDQIEMTKDEVLTLKAKARLNTGEEVDLEHIPKKFYTSAVQSATIDQNGVVTALQAGASQVFVEVPVQGGGLINEDLWIVVKDPEEFHAEALIAVTDLTHPRMKIEIGQPAVIVPGDVYPEIPVRANVDASISMEVQVNGSTIVGPSNPVAFAKGEEKALTIPGTADVPGQYTVKLKIEAGGEIYYDAFYFTVLEADAVPAGQSSVAFLNDQGKMVYVPDYKGNQILDFSNSGYMGGGVRLPDVQARIALEPGEGDDTARIQEAIDQVSLMPVGPDGFRGAVLLKQGTFRVAGTLNIHTGGVVLRGEGKGEDGTIILGTGKAARNLVVIGPNTAPVVDNGSSVEITDLFVPSGSRTFHVKDASGYQVGDTVMVRRVGNSRWIHEIGMDHIYMRPGGSGTNQWTPFNLDFDRVITAIDGNQITVDAPLANSIERRWGGGLMLKYNDEARIEHVGVENIRVVSEFDPSIKDTTNDNGKTDPYYADEQHAERFVVFNSVKNGWVREVTGYHLSYALVQIGRHAKWITVQDSEQYDMVSIITGGRRYSFYIQGQLNLVQRTYAETSRHAFVFDSRVQGPNVFLDSQSTKDYNTSEPHHRWSVGGLFDNISARINIRDRAWLGSGHGWSGANYVTWNTEGGLVSQQPPTAQNYAIGHIPNNDGINVSPLVPSSYDPRPRNNGFWEHEGMHVTPGSLYKQQLKERLGTEALENIKRTPVGGGDLDVPDSDFGDLPLLKEILVNGEALPGFSPDKFDYTYELPVGTQEVPQVAAKGQPSSTVEVTQAGSPNGKAVITARSEEENAFVQYTVQFKSLEVYGDIPPNLTVYPIMTARASDSHKDYPPENAIDKELGTRWAGKGEQWIEFDLGQERLISYVLMAQFQYLKYKFDIELSTDGNQWTKVYSGESSGLTELLEGYPIPDTYARYLRVVGHGNNKDAWNNVNEIVIAGDVPPDKPDRPDRPDRPN